MNKVVLQQAARLLERLDKDFALHHRKKHLVDRASGHYRGWFREVLSRPPQRLTVYQLISAAKGSGLDATELLAEAIQPGPLELLRSNREATHGRREHRPPVIDNLRTAARRAVRSRFDEPAPVEAPAPSVGDARAALHYGPLENRRRDLCLSPRWRSLEGVCRAGQVIDELRYRTPWEAVTLAEALAIDVAPRLGGSAGVEAFSRAAGVLGSSHRIAGSMEGAAWCLETALEVGGRATATAQAELYLRVGTALLSFGAYRASLRVIQKAAARFERDCCRSGLGWSWVDRAGVLYFLGDHSRAAESAKSALAILPEGENSNRSAAYQILAKLAVDANELQSADEYLEQAKIVVPGGMNHSRGMVYWSAGGLAKRRSQYAEAEEHLARAIELLGAVNPFDTTLATLDAIELQLVTGRVAEAIERSMQLAALLEPLRGNRVAASALIRLATLSVRGRICLQALEAAKEAVQGGRCRGIRPPMWTNRA